MRNPGQGVARVARGAVLAVACLALSLTAHVAGGGTAHLTPGVLVGGLALTAICVAVADARRTMGDILGIVLLSQIGLHLLAGAGGHHADPAGFGVTLEMVTVHGIAAVAISVLLGHGDRLVWALWSLARLPRIPWPAGHIPSNDVPAVTRDYRPAVPARRELSLSGPGTRAPPVV